MADDEDEEEFGGLYEDGHWAWDNNTQGLIFISHLPPKPIENVTISLKAPTGTIEFRDDIDLLEQMRFRRRYQRKLKPEQADIITLQDAKDIALYTAPINILTPMLINLLHQSTTERFIRALIIYCQYYLQIVEEMANRVIELETKVRTPDCSIKENEFSIDLSDIRLLIAKEYCTMLIELEVNRIFKTEIFNAVEHNLKTGYIGKMTAEERSVLLGHCVRHDKKLVTCSPLTNEVFCHRIIDYRLTGLGVIKYSQSASSRSSASGMRKSQTSVMKLYPDIKLPERETSHYRLPSEFPSQADYVKPCSETQRRRWINRMKRLLHQH